MDGAIKAPVLIGFLQRLIREAVRKVFLILDRVSVHRAAVVRDWLTRHKAQIEVFYLPSYSPELNPDEGLNADLNPPEVHALRSVIQDNEGWIYKLTLPSATMRLSVCLPWLSDASAKLNRERNDIVGSYPAVEGTVPREETQWRK